MRPLLRREKATIFATPLRTVKRTIRALCSIALSTTFSLLLPSSRIEAKVIACPAESDTRTSLQNLTDRQRFLKSMADTTLAFAHHHLERTQLHLDCGLKKKSGIECDAIESGVFDQVATAVHDLRLHLALGFEDNALMATGGALGEVTLRGMNLLSPMSALAAAPLTQSLGSPDLWARRGALAGVMRVNKGLSNLGTYKEKHWQPLTPGEFAEAQDVMTNNIIASAKDLLQSKSPKQSEGYSRIRELLRYAYGATDEDVQRYEASLDTKPHPALHRCQGKKSAPKLAASEGLVFEAQLDKIAQSVSNHYLLADPASREELDMQLRVLVRMQRRAHLAYYRAVLETEPFLQWMTKPVPTRSDMLQALQILVAHGTAEVARLESLQNHLQSWSKSAATCANRVDSYFDSLRLGGAFAFSSGPSAPEFPECFHTPPEFFGYLDYSSIAGGLALQDPARARVLAELIEERADRNLAIGLAIAGPFIAVSFLGPAEIALPLAALATVDGIGESQLNLMHARQRVLNQVSLEDGDPSLNWQSLKDSRFDAGANIVMVPLMFTRAVPMGFAAVRPLFVRAGAVALTVFAK